MKKFLGTLTGKIVIGAMVISALVTVAFVSPRLVSAASMPQRPGIEVALKHVTNEEAVERLTTLSKGGSVGPEMKDADDTSKTDIESGETEKTGMRDADSQGDEMGVQGQAKEGSTETSVSAGAQSSTNPGTGVSDFARQIGTQIRELVGAPQSEGSNH